MASASVSHSGSGVNAPGPAGTLARRRPVARGSQLAFEKRSECQEGQVFQVSGREGRDPADPAPGQDHGSTKHQSAGGGFPRLLCRDLYP